VDEALLAYLNTEGGVQNAEFEERLRDLLSYNPNPPAFSDAEKTRLIAAIDNVKVLDPAAGSGAFPMGVLHKLVFLLAKLDPQNEGWQRKQISKANEIQDSVAREAAVRSIEEVFAENHDDYGRKLYLIENCIYGVDIQPIAVQIAKLRFFISLVVDQKTNAKKQNLGIRPLPNLETKFVAANTLIGIQRPDSTLRQAQGPENAASIPLEVEEACEMLIRKLEQYLKSRNPDLRARYVQEAQEFADVINAGMGADFQPLVVDWVFSTAKDTAALKDLLPVKREAKASALVLRNQEIEKKEKELERVRREHFSARTPAAKRKYREMDKQLRAEISDLLKKDGWGSDTAKLLAGWDPYNQNAHADFFDPEWMFGVEGGFDVVIGNPPYGANFSPEEKTLYIEIFKHQNYQLDSYLLFIEKSFELLSQRRYLSLIIPNTWLSNLKLKNIRKFVFGDNTVLEISHYASKVFDAVVDTEVVIAQKGIINPGDVKIRHWLDGQTYQENKIPLSRIKKLDGEPINIFTSEKQNTLLRKIEANSLLLGELCIVTVGMKPYQVGKGKPKQTRQTVEKRPFDSEKKLDKSYLPLLRGRDIEKYLIKWDGKRWIKYGEHLAEPRNLSYFQASEKIVIRQTGDSLIATLDTSQFMCMNNLHTINLRDDKQNLLWILGLINSKLLNFYYQSLNPEAGEALAEVKKENVEKLIIFNANSNQEKPIIKLVTKILAAKRTDPQADTSAWEKEIDALVYQLYGLTEEEIRIVEGKA